MGAAGWCVRPVSQTRREHKNPAPPGTCLSDGDVQLALWGLFGYAQLDLRRLGLFLMQVDLVFFRFALPALLVPSRARHVLGRARRLDSGSNALDTIDVAHELSNGDSALRLHERAQTGHGLRVELVNAGLADAQHLANLLKR